MMRTWGLAITGVLISFAAGSIRAADVTFTRAPEGGLQPQAIVGDDNTVHVVYFGGEPRAGNLFYVRRLAGDTQFSNPIRINSEPRTAIAIGTIRGPQCALGKGGRLHVAWNGSGTASNHEGAPMLYTRMHDDGDTFEPQRDLMTSTDSLDGGGSVAADNRGQVYVAWHARAAGKSRAESDRAVFVAISTDEGKTFTVERQANSEPTGACGCCGMKAFADADGALYLLYREARNGVERGATILASRDGAVSFHILHTHPWHATTCPMSTAWLAPGNGQTLAAWETMGRVWFARIDAPSGKLTPPIAPAAGTKGQKHPIAVMNKSGETLLVWTEGTGWMKGGAVAWQVYDKTGQPTDVKGSVDGLPAWSLATAVATADDNFEIIY